MLDFVCIGIKAVKFSRRKTSVEPKTLNEPSPPAKLEIAATTAGIATSYSSDLCGHQAAMLRSYIQGTRKTATAVPAALKWHPGSGRLRSTLERGSSPVLMPLPQVDGVIHPVVFTDIVHQPSQA